MQPEHTIELICQAYLKHAVFVNKFSFGTVVVGRMFISVKVKCFFSHFIHAEGGQYSFTQQKRIKRKNNWNISTIMSLRSTNLCVAVCVENIKRLEYNME